MVFGQLFKTRPAISAGRALAANAIAQSRQPVFYAAWGAPDTREGRFELMTIHVGLLARRLKGHGPQAVETAQGLIDTYFGSLDISLREMGVGDLSMSKKMKRLGEAFYGRAKAYEDAFAALPDEAPMSELIGRTLLMDEGGAEPFVRYLIAAERSLAETPLERLLAGDAEWPEAQA